MKVIWLPVGGWSHMMWVMSTLSWLQKLFNRDKCYAAALVHVCTPLHLSCVVGTLFIWKNKLTDDKSVLRLHLDLLFIVPKYNKVRIFYMHVLKLKALQKPIKRVSCCSHFFPENFFGRLSKCQVVLYTVSEPCLSSKAVGKALKITAVWKMTSAHALKSLGSCKYVKGDFLCFINSPLNTAQTTKPITTVSV